MVALVPDGKGSIPQKTGALIGVGEIARGVFTLQYPDGPSAEQAYRKFLTDPSVAGVQYNTPVEFRRLPDDPRYGTSDNLARAGFPEAWDVTTGGTTAAGDRIVVAILDAGFDTDHEDLRDNLWQNPGELPGNGLDDDGNGFIDDLNGWNFADSSATHPADPHGTQVAGIIGARGDNGTGITGTNWDVDLMLFSIRTVADIIAAYTYIIEQRTLYEQTGGASGAYVVATNASFGIEGATCADYPTWGAMYDALGEVGILTAASVVNVPRNVDTFGDMPTDCPSDFLIGVTNVGADDNLFPSAGFGLEHVDLAGPGEGSLTTRPGNRYATFGSTSAAAPYVSGAIALLHSVPCLSLASLAADDPAAFAISVREQLLKSVRRRPGLRTTTASGGILNVASAVDLLQTACMEREQAVSIDAAFPNPTDGKVTFRLSRPIEVASGTAGAIDGLGRIIGLPGPVAVREYSEEVTVNLAELPQGWYLVVLQFAGYRVRYPVVLR